MRPTARSALRAWDTPSGQMNANTWIVMACAVGAGAHVWWRAQGISLAFWFEYWRMPWSCLLEARSDPAWRLFAPWEPLVQPEGHWRGGWIGPIALRVQGETWTAYVWADGAKASMDRIAGIVRVERLAITRQMQRARAFRVGKMAGAALRRAVRALASR